MTGPMAYVSRIKDCGCVVAVICDEPYLRDEIAEFTADHIKRGYDVERVSLETARALPWGWPCEHMKARAADESLSRAAAPAEDSQ